uniref:Hypoxia up-regulated protein 1 n=1 Tax=Mesocestoides corti TaxID=53468 RepID=A0A5K3FR84_MESCO
MFLKYVKKTAETFADSELKTAVITVPSYFTQAERRALLRSASLANIEVIQLLDDNVAVALDYIRPRIKQLEQKPVYLFCDIGATGTTATVVSYQMSELKGDLPGKHPHIFVLSAVSDASLGINAFVDRLQAHLMDAFREQHNIKADITAAPRTVAKFRREASRVFKILSANKEIQSIVEEIYENHDLRLLVSREQLEELCADLVQRVQRPLLEALELANTPAENIKEVIVFGGGSRIPAIQEAILRATKKEALGKSVNADEAAAMGAIYQAAYHTRGFLVKRFVLRESNRYPMAVTFPRITSDSNADTAVGEMVTRVLFPANNPFPQKRTIKFPRLQEDITFHVHYADPSESMKDYLDGAVGVLNASISGINEEMQKFDREGYKPQAVKAHLELDASGILRLSEVNLIMSHVSPEDKADDNASTLKKFADGISNLFGSSEGKAPDRTNITAPQSPESSSDGEDPEQANQTQSTEPPRNLSEPGSYTPVIPQKKTMLHPLPFHVKILDYVNPPKESIGSSLAILQEYEDADNERDLLNRAKNDLEKIIFATFAYIDNAFDNHTTSEELDSLRQLTNEISDWYEEEGYHAPRSAVEERLTMLRDAIDPFLRRVKAFAELPNALDSFEEVLNAKARTIALFMYANTADKAITASEYVQNLNASVGGSLDDKKVGLPIYTDEEVDVLRKLTTESQNWLKKTREALAICDNKADPPVHLSEVMDRKVTLSAKLEYYAHKGEVWLITYKRLLDIKKAAAVTATAAPTTEESDTGDKSATNTTPADQAVVSDSET